MQIAYEIKEVKENLYGFILACLIGGWLLFYYFADKVPICIRFSILLLIIICGIANFRLCIRSTSFVIENGNLTIWIRHRKISMRLDDIKDIILLETRHPFPAMSSSSRYHARLITKRGSFSYKSVHNLIYKQRIVLCDTRCDIDMEEKKFCSCFMYLSRAAKVSIKGTGNYGKIPAKSIMAFKGDIFLIVICILLATFFFLMVSGVIPVIHTS